MNEAYHFRKSFRKVLATPLPTTPKPQPQNSRSNVFGRKHGSSKKNSLSRDQMLESKYEKLVDEKCEQYMYHMYPFPYTQMLSVLLNITEQPTCSHCLNPKFGNSTVHHSHDRAFLHWKVNLPRFIPFSP